MTTIYKHKEREKIPQKLFLCFYNINNNNTDKDNHHINILLNLINIFVKNFYEDSEEQDKK